MIKNIIVIVLVVSCAVPNTLENSRSAEKLDFRSCLLEEKGFDYVNIELPQGFKRRHRENHGFCEFDFLYADSSIIYISTDIYSGSRLNWENLGKIGINTYAKGRNLLPTDTTMNSGIQSNGKYWLERVMGGYVVGYVNANEDKKNMYLQSIESVVLY